MDHVPASIIDRALRNEPEAREELYRRTAGFVYNVALGVTASPDLAEDVTQNVFIAVFSSLKDFQRRSSLETWLYRVTVNTALNARGQGARQARNRVDIDGITETLADPVSLEDAAEQRHAAADCHRLLQQLSPEQRTCVVLRDMQGLSYAEIADAMSANINTVRTWLRRGRESLLRIGEKEGV